MQFAIVVYDSQVQIPPCVDWNVLPDNLRSGMGLPHSMESSRTGRINITLCQM